MNPDRGVRPLPCLALALGLAGALTFPSLAHAQQWHGGSTRHGGAHGGTWHRGWGGSPTWHRGWGGWHGNGWGWGGFGFGLGVPFYLPPPVYYPPYPPPWYAPPYPYASPYPYPYRYPYAPSVSPGYDPLAGYADTCYAPPYECTTPGTVGSPCSCTTLRGIVQGRIIRRAG